MLAIQKTGQGEAADLPVAIEAAWVVIAVMAFSAADVLHVDGRVGRQASVHLARDLVGEHFVGTGFERAQCRSHDRIGCRFRNVESTCQVGVDEANV